MVQLLATTDDDQQSFTAVLSKRGKRLRRRSSQTQDTMSNQQQQRLVYEQSQLKLDTSIGTMSASRTVSEIFSVKECRDLEIGVIKGRSRLLNMVPFDR